MLLHASIRDMEDQTSSNNSTNNNNSQPTGGGPSSKQSVASSTFSLSTTNTTSPTAAVSRRRRRYSRAVGRQGILYASGIGITNLPMVLNVVLWNVFGVWNHAYGVFATTTMVPLFGYVNVVVFLRNRKLEDCQTTYGRWYRRAHSFLLEYMWTCHCHCHCLLPS